MYCTSSFATRRRTTPWPSTKSPGRPFLIIPFSRQTEHQIVRGLREAGALKLSLVATMDGRVVGHVAFSPVMVGAQDPGWWGIGPVSVAPAHQRSGIGSSLIRSGLRRLRESGVAGCVVLGDPAHYGRFGFFAACGPGLPWPACRPLHGLGAGQCPADRRGELPPGVLLPRAVRRGIPDPRVLARMAGQDRPGRSHGGVRRRDNSNPSTRRSWWCPRRISSAMRRADACN
jgi:putative acetyltransferase